MPRHKQITDLLPDILAVDKAVCTYDGGDIEPHHRTMLGMAVYRQHALKSLVDLYILHEYAKEELSALISEVNTQLNVPNQKGNVRDALTAKKEKLNTELKKVTDDCKNLKKQWEDKYNKLAALATKIVAAVEAQPSESGESDPKIIERNKDATKEPKLASVDKSKLTFFVDLFKIYPNDTQRLAENFAFFGSTAPHNILRFDARVRPAKGTWLSTTTPNTSMNALSEAATFFCQAYHFEGYTDAANAEAVVNLGQRDLDEDGNPVQVPANHFGRRDFSKELAAEASVESASARLTKAKTDRDNLLKATEKARRIKKDDPMSSLEENVENARRQLDDAKDRHNRLKDALAAISSSDASSGNSPTHVSKFAMPDCSRADLLAAIKQASLEVETCEQELLAAQSQVTNLARGNSARSVLSMIAKQKLNRLMHKYTENNNGITDLEVALATAETKLATAISELEQRKGVADGMNARQAKIHFKRFHDAPETRADYVRTQQVVTKEKQAEILRALIRKDKNNAATLRGSELLDRYTGMLKSRDELTQIRVPARNQDPVNIPFTAVKRKKVKVVGPNAEAQMREPTDEEVTQRHQRLNDLLGCYDRLSQQPAFDADILVTHQLVANQDPNYKPDENKIAAYGIPAGHAHQAILDFAKEQRTPVRQTLTSQVRSEAWSLARADLTQQILEMRTNERMCVASAAKNEAYNQLRGVDGQGRAVDEPLLRGDGPLPFAELLNQQNTQLQTIHQHAAALVELIRNLREHIQAVLPDDSAVSHSFKAFRLEWNEQSTIAETRAYIRAAEPVLNSLKSHLRGALQQAFQTMSPMLSAAIRAREAAMAARDHAARAAAELVPHAPVALDDMDIEMQISPRRMNNEGNPAVHSEERRALLVPPQERPRALQYRTGEDASVNTAVMLLNERADVAEAEADRAEQTLRNAFPENVNTVTGYTALAKFLSQPQSPANANDPNDYHGKINLLKSSCDKYSRLETRIASRESAIKKHLSDALVAAEEAEAAEQAVVRMREEELKQVETELENITNQIEQDRGRDNEKLKELKLAFKSLEEQYALSPMRREDWEIQIKPTKDALEQVEKKMAKENKHEVLLRKKKLALEIEISKSLRSERHPPAAALRNELIGMACMPLYLSIHVRPELIEAELTHAQGVASTAYYLVDHFQATEEKRVEEKALVDYMDVQDLDITNTFRSLQEDARALDKAVRSSGWTFLWNNEHDRAIEEFSKQATQLSRRFQQVVDYYKAYPAEYSSAACSNVKAFTTAFGKAIIHLNDNGQLNQMYPATAKDGESQGTQIISKPIVDIFTCMVALGILSKELGGKSLPKLESVNQLFEEYGLRGKRNNGLPFANAITKLAVYSTLVGGDVVGFALSIGCWDTMVGPGCSAILPAASAGLRATICYSALGFVGGVSLTCLVLAIMSYKKQSKAGEFYRYTPEVLDSELQRIYGMTQQVSPSQSMSAAEASSIYARLLSSSESEGEMLPPIGLGMPDFTMLL